MQLAFRFARDNAMEWDYWSLSPPRVSTTARSIGDAPREIELRHIRNCLKAVPAYGKGIAVALGIPLSAVKHGPLVLAARQRRAASADFLSPPQ